MKNKEQANEFFRAIEDHKISNSEYVSNAKDFAALDTPKSAQDENYEDYDDKQEDEEEETSD